MAAAAPKPEDRLAFADELAQVSSSFNSSFGSIKPASLMVSIRLLQIDCLLQQSLFFSFGSCPRAASPSTPDGKGSSLSERTSLFDSTKSLKPPVKAN